MYKMPMMEENTLSSTQAHVAVPAARTSAAHVAVLVAGTAEE
jgi:hypothetical protein